MSVRMRKILCVAAYILPLILGVLVLIYTALPHMWFVYNHAAHETVSVSTLRENTREVCKPILANPDAASAPDRNFAYAATALAVVCDVGTTLYVLVFACAAICAAVAFSLPPTHRYANRAKRILRFVCPGRVCYLLSLLWILLPTLFPHLLLFCYQHLQGLSMKLFFDPMPTWVTAAIAIALCATLYILTLPWQAQEHLDMFRIYKSRASVPRAGDETL